MDLLFVALHVLFFVPVAIRAAGAIGGERTDIVEEVATGIRKPALLLHGIGLLSLWVGIVFALVGGQVSRTATVQGVFGAGVLVGAVLLMTWSITALRSWRLLPKVGAQHELCTKGPYGFVRHPMYLALDLLGLGSVLWVQTGAVVVATGLLVLGGDLRARLEEKALIEAFGQRYLEYVRRVRRILPFVY